MKPRIELNFALKELPDGSVGVIDGDGLCIIKANTKEEVLKDFTDFLEISGFAPTYANIVYGGGK